jgi:hypothetical protein
MAIMPITNENRPVTLELPDKDIVQLPPWEYIIDRLEIDLRPSIEKLRMINTSLSQIDSKLTTWVPREKQIPVYEILEWLQSDGQAYINTNIPAFGNQLKFTAELSIPDNEEIHPNSSIKRHDTFLGVTESDTHYIQRVGHSSTGGTPSQNSQQLSYFINYTGDSTNNDIRTTWWFEHNGSYLEKKTMFDEKATMYYRINGSEFSINGNSITCSSTESPGDLTYTLFLFAKNNDGVANNICKYLRMYSFDCTARGVHYHLVPARRVLDGQVGVLDTINNVFYLNAGDGEFMYGDVKNTINVTVPRE